MPHPPYSLSGPFRKRLDAFAHELGRVEKGEVEALHRTRVASRRLRELVPLLELDHGVTRKLARRLRKVTKQLGTVRECDVLVLLIGELARKGVRYSPAALKQLGAAAIQARAAARQVLSDKLPTAKLERLARKLDRVSQSLESGDAKRNRHSERRPRRAWLWVLEARLARRAARVQAAVDAAGAVYVPERLHGVRIAVKKLRYAAEIAAEAAGKRTAVVAALVAAQDVLGRLHDLEVLLVRAREAQAALYPPDLARWRDLASLVHVVEDDCRQLHARYMHDRTELIAIANRMGAGSHQTQLVGRAAV